MRFFYLFILLLLFSGCEFLKTSDETSKKNDTNVIKQYRNDGSIKTEVPVLDGKRHGLAKNFYANGKVQQEIHYIRNKKHGLATTYYKTGIKYMVTPYDSGIIHGVRKTYRQDGALMAEVPFYKGKPTAGLKEYLLNGKEKTAYPKIKIKPVDEIMLRNRYTLKLSVSDASKKVEYFLGKLDENKMIPLNAVPLQPTRPGESEIVYPLPPGAFKMEQVNIIALAYTKLNNPYITEASFNLAIENRGF